MCYQLEIHVNTATKFKSIQVGAKGVQFQSPYLYDPYNQMTPRKDLIKAWNEECRLREAELKILNSRYNRP